MVLIQALWDPWINFRTAKAAYSEMGETGGSPQRQNNERPKQSIAETWSEMFGGAERREWIVGGFPVWSRKAKIEKTMKDVVIPQLPEPVRDNVESAYAFGLAVVKNDDGEKELADNKPTRDGSCQTVGS